MILHIKNMVCSRCIMVVENELKKMNFPFVSVELGEVKLAKNISDTEKQQLEKALQVFGFSLIEDKKIRIIEKIKNIIVDLVHQKDNEININLSNYLSQKLNQDYSYLSNLFTSIENSTIEHYFISQKVERIKELLDYDELSLSEIADKLNYNSLSHLSKQFKKITGISPTLYKNQHSEKRKRLEEV